MTVMTTAAKAEMVAMAAKTTVTLMTVMTTAGMTAPLAMAASVTRIVLGSVQVYYVGTVVLSRPVGLLTLGPRLCQLEWPACDWNIAL